MIEQLSITNLKCFTQLDLRPGALTLLAGVNSAGKSTVIQAVLLDALARRGRRHVPLSGEFGLAMGDAVDVLNRDATDQEIRIEMTTADARSVCRLRVPDDLDALTLDVLDGSVWPAEVSELGSYLCAERLGPRETQEVHPTPDSGVGHQGQFTAQVLVQAQIDRRRASVPEGRRAPADVAPTVGAQAEAWLSRIVRPIQIEARRIPNSSLATLRFRESAVAEWSRPANVGFGLSYALPIVVAGLTTPAGRLLVVENPEAHLHPAGQSAMAEFLARVAASGVQVIVETHSDHVVNGIRRTVATERLLPASEIAIYAFGGDGTATRIEVTEVGTLTAWPEQFFDQLQKDLLAISRGAAARR